MSIFCQLTDSQERMEERKMNLLWELSRGFDFLHPLHQASPNNYIYGVRLMR